MQVDITAAVVRHRDVGAAHEHISDACALVGSAALVRRDAMHVRVWEVRQADAEGNPTIVRELARREVSDGETFAILTGGFGSLFLRAERGAGETAYLADRIGARGVEVDGARIVWERMA